MKKSSLQRSWIVQFCLYMTLLLVGVPGFGAAEVAWEAAEGLSLSAAHFSDASEGVVAVASSWPRTTRLDFIARGVREKQIEIPQVYVNRIRQWRDLETGGQRFFACGAMGSEEHDATYSCRLYGLTDDDRLEMLWTGENLPAPFGGESAMIRVSPDGKMWGSVATIGAKRLELVIGRFPEVEPFATFSIQRDPASLPSALSEEFPEFEFLSKDSEPLLVAVLWSGMVDVMGSGTPSQKAKILPTGRGDESGLMWSSQARELWMLRGTQATAYAVPQEFSESGKSQELEAVTSFPCRDMDITGNGEIAFLRRSDELLEVFLARDRGVSAAAGMPEAVLGLTGEQNRRSTKGILAGGAYVTAESVKEGGRGGSKIRVYSLR